MLDRDSLPRDLVCSMCRVDIARHGYCIDGVFYCPECSWNPQPAQQTFAFDAPSRVVDTPDVAAVSRGVV